MLKLETFQNKALRTVTGQLQTTPLEALRAESAMISITTASRRATAVAYEKALRLRTDHPRRRAAVPRGHHRSHRSSWRKEATMTLATLPEELNRREDLRSNKEAPWARMDAEHWKTVLTIPGGFSKASPVEELRKAAMDTIESIQANRTIYTDGSAEAGVMKGGAAAVVTSGPPQEIVVEDVIRTKRRSLTSSFEEERQALLDAIRWIQETNQSGKMAICSDSQAALSALHNGSLEMEEVRTALNQCRCEVVIQWIPGYTDIPGNEKADSEAKRAAGLQPGQRILPISFATAKATIIRHISDPIGNHQRTLSVYGGKVRDLGQLERKDAVLIAQLRSGHCTKLAAYKATIDPGSTHVGALAPGVSRTSSYSDVDFRGGRPATIGIGGIPATGGSVCAQVLGSGRRKLGHIEEEEDNSNSERSTRGKRGILHTAVASVSGRKASVKARLMLDSCATDSFIQIGMANKIGAQKMGKELVDHGAFEGQRVPEYRTVFSFNLKLAGGAQMEIQAYGSEQITPDIYKPAIDVEHHPILAHVHLAEPLIDEGEMVSVDILLGTDYREEIVHEERLTLGDDLYLLDSKLGYVITGRINGTACMGSTVNVCAVKNCDPHIDFEKLYSLDQIGIRDTKDTNDDEESVASFNRTLRYDRSEQRYYAKWPVRQVHAKLPSNFGVAYGRLKSFKRNADEIPQLLESTKAIFDDQLSKEVIEEAPQTPDGLPAISSSRTPHKTTTKCRIVYDASSKANKRLPSLNDTLYRGPVLLENLIGLILRFRLQKVGIVSDIEKAFLQIGLQKADRDLVRFLWLRDPGKPVSDANLVILRFRRVCFGAVSSPFILAATVDHHLKKTGTPTAAEISRNIYVDNVIRSVSSCTAATSYYTEAKRIFNSASMNLREWFSNDEDFTESIPVVDRGEGAATKVLGLRWNLRQDTLECPFEGAETGDNPTKRFILHILAKVYDPCGFFTPVTSPGKWILQDLWLQNLGWDEALPENIVSSWHKVATNLNQLPDCPIPRCYDYSANPSECAFEIHAFCDASERAYAAAFYLVMRPTVGEPTSSLIFSKCRVSPIKKQKQTIPRLELLAATIGARLLEFLVDELGLPIGAKYLWSDSKCVLYWILGTPVSKLFVRNRVGSIRKGRNVTYRYVPSADNPADLPTRGTSVKELKTPLMVAWPAWLLDPDQWPETPTKDVESQPVDNEAVGFGPVIAAVTGPPPDIFDYVFDPSRYSNLNKLLRVTACSKRFIKNCRKKTQRRRHTGLRGHHPSDVSQSTHLSAKELEDARVFWEKTVQQHHFADFLSSNGTELRTLKSLAALIIDPGGIIRCVSRLQEAQLPDAAKAPKLLPKGDPFTRLVIQHYHAVLNHVGVKHTLAELRCEYWIIHGRSQVKQVIRRSGHCQHIKGKPFRMPKMPALPEFRVSQRAPFACTGLDYLGPLYVFPKNGDSTKVWICLFTCASTSAIHLELVSSMNTAQFLMALRRFMPSYGVPELLVSDNAGQFHTSRRILDNLWEDACRGPAVQQFSSSKGIDWKFITQAAPWMGGFYEHLVGLVKSNLKSALFRQRLDMTELQTVVCEVSTIINSRPLVDCEDEVGNEALTPAHLLMRHRSIKPLQLDSNSSAATKNEWILTWKRIQNILSRFWKSWQKQYLLSLHQYNRPVKQRNVLDVTPQVGEIVLIAEEHMLRSAWKYGRVTERVMSSDNRCRTVKLMLPGGIPLTRPVKLLYSLELRDVNPQNSSDARTEGLAQPDAEQPPRVSVSRATEASPGLLPATRDTRGNRLSSLRDYSSGL